MPGLGPLPLWLQYFKRKRAAVEVVLVAGSGVGLALMSIFIQVGIR